MDFKRRFPLAAMIALVAMSPAGRASASEALATRNNSKTTPLTIVADVGNSAHVFQWTSEHCAEWDVPDAPLRAFRRSDDTVAAFATADTNQIYLGSSLLTIRHSCHSALKSGENPDPASYDGNRFLTSTWTSDGREVFGLVHDEYHADHFHSCAHVTPLACWYTTIIAVKSQDGGETFSTSVPPQVVAAAPMRQDAEQFRHRGFFNPSNILQDGAFWYVMTNTTGGGPQKPGLCLFRTDDISDPKRWRGYDGTGFNAATIDPYREDLTHYMPCKPVDHLATIGSISRHKASGRYLAVFQGPDGQHPDGQIAYSWSTDLIHWDVPRNLLDVSDMSSKNCEDRDRYGYPSVLDPDAPGRNFDVIGDAPVLFVTLFHVKDCHMPPNRDLVRIPLRVEAR